MNYAWWLACLHEVKRRHRLSFLQKYGTAQALFRMAEEDLLMCGCFTPEEVTGIIRARNPDKLKREQEYFQKKGIRFAGYGSDDYPERLMHIPDPPLGLFYKGSLPKDPYEAAGIVGARMCSEYGRSIANELGRRFAKAGVAVVSGMARGIDSASHAGTLSEGGITYAVLGCGCDVVYPRSSRQIYENIIASGGGIISEYGPGTQPLPFFFPERNRIISGLSNVLIIAEAKEKSGSLITADCAMEQGRDVYAVPGRVGDLSAVGCNRLIWQGATILYDLDQFFSDMGMFQQIKINDLSRLTEKERMVYDCLTLHAKSAGELLEELPVKPSELTQILGRLKEYQVIKEDFRNYYSIYPM